jgi:hypothetical protein
MKTTVIKEIASRIIAIRNCQKSGNTEWEAKHKDFLHCIEKHLLPSGSGIDSGTKIDLQRSQPNRIILTTAFHHMDDAGGYDRWTQHDIVVSPSLAFDFDVSIRGQNHNDIKDYLADLLHTDLEREIDTKEIFERQQNQQSARNLGLPIA